MSQYDTDVGTVSKREGGAPRFKFFYSENNVKFY